VQFHKGDTMTVRKALIPAAGFGTRFLPATKSQPKEMLPVVDTPVIQHVVEEAVASGITDILMVIGRGKRAIEEHFDRSFELEDELAAKGKEEALNSIRHISELADIHFVWQKEMNGLGDAVACGRHHIGREPFAVLLGDTVMSPGDPDMPVTQQLLDVFDKNGRSVVALEKVGRERVSRYGVIDGEPIGDGVYRIRDIVEKPSPESAPSNLVVASRYVLTPEIFACLEVTQRGKNDEIQLTDALHLLLEKQAMFGLHFKGKRYDVGNKLDFIKTNIEFALMDTHLHDELLAFIRELAGRER